MSAASRQRELDRRHLRLRRGFPTWEAFRSHQRTQLAAWRDTPEITAEKATLLVRDAYGRVTAPPRLFAHAFDGEQVAMTYPEPDLGAEMEGVAA